MLCFLREGALLLQSVAFIVQQLQRYSSAVKEFSDGMLQTPGMLMGLVVVVVVLWWEDSCEDAEIDKTGMLF